MADARKFIFNSDYPTPAFVAKWEGSLSISGYGYLDTGINHGLPFTPLIVGQWSMNANFSPAYDLTNQNGYFFDVPINQATGATDSQINFRINNGYESTRNFYYRIFAFAPTDYDGDIPAIEDASNFRFNSDFNYPKLFAAGNPTATSETLVVNHNLGYIPQARVWVNDDNHIGYAPIANTHYQDGAYDIGVYVDESKMTVITSGSGAKIYYHIYADEA